MKRLVFLLLIVFSFFSCSEEDIFIPPNVVTKDAENLPGGGVKLTGNFNNFGENDVLGFLLYSVSESTFRNIENPVSGDNSVIIESGLYKDREYRYNTYVQTQDSTYFGLIKTFVSTGSKKIVFNKIEPSSGNFETEVRISTNSDLKNINLKDVSVFFNDKIASITSIENNAIVCNVPYYENNPTAEIKINFFGDENSTNLKFNLLKPEITSINPNEVTFRDKFIINGKNFSKRAEYNSVFINDMEAQTRLLSENSIEVKVSDEANTESLAIKLVTNLQEVIVNNALTLIKPMVTQAPQKIALRELMTIFGKNFHPLGKHTKVFLDDNEHYLVNWVNDSWYPTRIGITVKDDVYKDWNVKAKVIVSEVLETQEFDVEITDPIIKIKDSYDDVITDYNCDYNGIRYVFGVNDSNQMVFHQFNKNTDEFFNRKIVELPLNTVNSVVYNKGYVYVRNNAGEENYYRINMQNFSIEILADYTGNRSATPFYIDENKIIYKYQEAYSSQGVDLFEYNINTNSWDFRTDKTSATVTRVFYNNFGKTYFLEGIYSAIKYIYVFDGTEFKKSNLELPVGFKDYFSEIIFEDNKFYFIEKSGRGLNTNRIMVLNLITNQWTEYKDFLFDDLEFINSFKVDNFIYLESVNTSNYKRKLYKLDLNKL